MRRRIIVGNWKMNGSADMARSLVADVVEAAQDVSVGVDVVVCPPLTHFAIVAGLVADSSVSIGAQNVSEHPAGAHTGEVSSCMLKEIGCEYVIVGHSERRAYHGESDDEVGRKAKAAMSQGINAIACVGETLEERQSERTRSVIERQLDSILDATDGIEPTGLSVAYEPVWAIGTGLTASTDQIQEVHGWIRDGLRRVSDDAAQNCRILYGGSVNGDNATGIIDQKDVDGCLVGGASLKSIEFLKICNAAV